MWFICCYVLVVQRMLGRPNDSLNSKYQTSRWGKSQLSLLIRILWDWESHDRGGDVLKKTLQTLWWRLWDWLRIPLLKRNLLFQYIIYTAVRNVNTRHHLSVWLFLHETPNMNLWRSPARVSLDLFYFCLFHQFALESCFITISFKRWDVFLDPLSVVSLKHTWRAIRPMNQPMGSVFIDHFWISIGNYPWNLCLNR